MTLFLRRLSKLWIITLLCWTTSNAQRTIRIYVCMSIESNLAFEVTLFRILQLLPSVCLPRIFVTTTYGLRRFYGSSCGPTKTMRTAQIGTTFNGRDVVIVSHHWPPGPGRGLNISLQSIVCTSSFDEDKGSGVLLVLSSELGLGSEAVVAGRLNDWLFVILWIVDILITIIITDIISRPNEMEKAPTAGMGHNRNWLIIYTLVTQFCDSLIPVETFLVRFLCLLRRALNHHPTKHQQPLYVYCWWLSWRP